MEDLLEKVVESEEDTQKDKYLIFSIGNECYGIDIKYVTEIIGIEPITEVPELPNYIKGVINLRGKIIPVMDVRLRFKKEPKEYDDRTCIVVVEIGNINIGLIIDRVLEVVNIDESNISPPPKINSNKDNANKYIKGIGKTQNEVRLLIDCHKLLEEDEIEEIKSVEL
ncbi:chemotaxis protein CheW [Clostridium saccharoperbutylacetonicum]|uniref:Chemotaxis signal transduction protein n=2 Tax=Clostridium TaxID=1485 RepID=M1MHH9_9CLOT|nr:chemotaxis protein CheW [Clostridium saccharoperbutylacetonicum]AGF57374.1 chemotaxis signal transduction protein [Clostridium saccharoperbutylacetonicum N1-4(HMT)]AQR96073.1 chemotaxis protein CheW [Clostridium saccharoperbutylacetonicum]NRT61862.1 purine-binding chemotaxis protein CheW [Clostridium saccharoperbutylacetonicum]NSB25188.1 purine-binding chemotaxis protein CheW [Clostridium saccharoperbutylacetonicum]NSB31942.1 purine-binding chemotaxis protein CheW [Clostridium saccharoperbu